MLKLINCMLLFISLLAVSHVELQLFGHHCYVQFVSRERYVLFIR